MSEGTSLVNKEFEQTTNIGRPIRLMKMATTKTTRFSSFLSKNLVLVLFNKMKLMMIQKYKNIFNMKHGNHALELLHFYFTCCK